MSELAALIRIFRLNGTWADKSEHISGVNHLRRFLPAIVIIFWSFCGLISAPMYIYLNNDNLPEVAIALSNIVNTTLVLANFLTIHLQNKELEELVEIMDGFRRFSLPKNKSTKRICYNCKRFCLLLSKLPKITAYMNGVLASFGAIAGYSERNFEHLAKLWFPINIKAIVVYELFTIFMVIQMVVIFTHVLTICLLIVYMFVQAFTQLKILNIKIRSIREIADEELCCERLITEVDANEVAESEETQGNRRNFIIVPEIGNGYNRGLTDNLQMQIGRGYQGVLDAKMESLLGECVKHHNEILRFIGKFGDTWSPFFGVHITVCLVHSVLILFSLTMDAPGATASTTVLILVCLNVYLELAVFNYLSQKVTDECESLQEAIYSSDWTGSTKSFKTSLCIMISVTNQPPVITAVGFIPLSIETLNNVIQTAYSNYMVLSSFT